MKKYLLSLLVGFVGLIGFCSSDLVLIDSGTVSVENFASYQPLYVRDFGNSNIVHRTFCLSGFVSSGPAPFDYNKSQFRFGGNDNINYSIGGNYFQFYLLSGFHIFGCVYIDNFTYSPKYLSLQKVVSSSSYAVSVDLDYEVYELLPGGGSSSCEDEIDYLSGQLSNCLSYTDGFNSQLNNCNSNLNACNLSLTSCLQVNCPVSSGGISWSSLFINDIQHIGAGIINITIPEEISWDYTGDETIFDLDINGYNVNSEYIDGIIRTQNSKPTNEDFNRIITELIPLFVPGLLIILFLYFVFKFIKKVF